MSGLTRAWHRDLCSADLISSQSAGFGPLSGKSRLFHYKQKHCQLSSQTQNQSCTAPIFLSLILKIAYLALCNLTSYLRFHTNTFQRDEGGVFAVDHLCDSLKQERQR